MLGPKEDPKEETSVRPLLLPAKILMRQSFLLKEDLLPLPALP